MKRKETLPKKIRKLGREGTKMFLEMRNMFID